MSKAAELAKFIGSGTLGSSANTLKHSGGTSAITIDSSARVFKPSQPAFEAWYDGSALTLNSGSNAGLVFNYVEQQGGTNYSTSTGKFTCPVTGFYSFSLKNGGIYGVNAGNFIRHGVIQNGTGFNTDEDFVLGYMLTGDTGDHSILGSFVKKYTAGDTLQPFIRVEESGSGSQGRRWQNFSGFLIG